MLLLSSARERAASSTQNGSEDMVTTIHEAKQASGLNGQVGSGHRHLNGDPEWMDAEWRRSRALLGEPDMPVPVPPNANYPIHRVDSTSPMHLEHSIKPSHSPGPVPPPKPFVPDSPTRRWLTHSTDRRSR